jgi:hypothetical protein
MIRRSQGAFVAQNLSAKLPWGPRFRKNGDGGHLARPYRVAPRRIRSSGRSYDPLDGRGADS